MKKTLVSALTAALVVGAASTTFAAANPFSDVPSDHWAYDAVTQLAKDGVIEGYGDTTFQGNKNITRYEMAQMVAKAMAKTNVSSTDKALIDKLAAEFSDELNNLGVRVSNLEKNADKVKWNGELRADASHKEVKNTDGSKTKTNKYPLKFRLEPSAEVNSHWHVNARLDADTNLNTDSASNDKDKVTLKRAYAQGDYKDFTVKAGKIPMAIDNVLLYDDELSGVSMTFGNKLKATVEAGRWDMGADDISYNSAVKANKSAFSADTADMYGIGLQYGANKLSLGAAYTDIKTNGFKTLKKYSNDGKEDKAGTWSANAHYRFDNNVALGGIYAENTKADNYKKAGSVELDYKGAQKANAGTWGAYVGYRHLGQNVAFDPFYNDAEAGQKGWVVGANYAPFKNVVAQVNYFDGKSLDDKDASKVFGRVEFFF
jgi:hypothetical protein